MKKKLTNPTIATELRQGSAFFRRPIEDTPVPPASAKAVNPVAPQPAPTAEHAVSHDTEAARHHDRMTSRYHDRLIEDIRKAVKVVGREPDTIRLTEQEKVQLTDIIYTLGRQGTRTSENELYRIALNFVVQDWQKRGKESVLARVLDALHA